MGLQIEKFIEEFKKSPDIMKEKVIDFFQYLKYRETEKNGMRSIIILNMIF